MKKIILALAAATIMHGIPSEAKSVYTNPTGKEFPILAWYSIIGDENQTPERYKELREAGFNLSFSHTGSPANVEKAMQACKNTGVKLVVMTASMEGNTAEEVNRLKGDPDLALWFLRDEPVVSGFEQLRAFRDRIYENDGLHMGYLNLLPDMVEPQVLGTKNYEEYVRRYVDEVDLPMISYDFYPIVKDGENVVVRPTFYENLEIVRKVALEKDMPFWAFCLSTAHAAYPVPQPSHLRVEAWSALAYGAQGLQYFTYWSPGTEVWDFHNAPINEKGERTNVYYMIKTLNREIQGLAPIFLGAKAEAVWHTGAKLPQGTQPLKDLPIGIKAVAASEEGVVVSHLANGKKHYLMVVNRDIHNPQDVTLTAEKEMTRILPDASRLKPEIPTGQPVRVAAGDYLLYEFKYQKPPKVKEEKEKKKK